MNIRQKILFYILGLFLSVAILLAITFLFSYINQGVLFFSAFMIAIISGILGSLVYTIREKDGFTNFLVIFSYVLFNLFFIYIGPVTLDRSLSSFVYFYSVENGSISRDIYRDEYFHPYIQRRFDDGVKIGYLKCENNICKPTFKTKFTYTVLYPIGRMSNVLRNYDEFSDFMKKLDSKQKNDQK